VTEVEVYEVLGFVGDKGAEVAPYDAMPGWAFSLIKLEYGQHCSCGSNAWMGVYSLLDMHCNVLLRGTLVVYSKGLSERSKSSPSRCCILT
jgi:hypothetical protein